MSHYVVAVGGTGQHIALALADYYVLTHSVTEEILTPPSFVLVDADPAAGGENERSSAWTLACEQLNVLNEMPDAAKGAPRPKWRSALPGVLRDEVRYAKQALDAIFAPGAASLLLTTRQENIEIGSGYHCEPRVAAAMADVMIKELVNDQHRAANDPLGRVFNTMQSRTSRVCVVGSAIGGTGAGILPRLVTSLAAATSRQAELCAVIGLPWFQLQNEGALGARMSDNSRACLWHYFRAMEEPNFRLVLWGHPRVTTANSEHDDGAKKQGVKSDLTLPYYAAASTQAFLVAAAGGQGERTELERVTVAPVGPRSGDVALIDSLNFGYLSLRELIDRNNQFLGMMKLLESYLRRPPSNAVARWFSRELQVPSLNALSPQERDDLLSRMQRLVVAKGRALDRLRRSDSTNMFQHGAPVSYQGLDGLSHWFARDVNLAAVAGHLQSRSPKRESSESYLLPTEASEVASLTPDDAGGRAAIQQPHREALAPFAKLQVSRIPDINGVEMVLSEAMKNRALWDVQGSSQELPALLINGKSPAVPLRFGATSSDGYVSWMKRWFMVFTSLMNRRARVEQLKRPIQFQAGGASITHRIMLDQAAANAPSDIEIGYLSEEILCVPSMSSLWENEEVLQKLSEDLHAITPTQDWIRAVRQVGECKLGTTNTPAWLQFLAEVLPSSRDGASTPLGLDESQSVTTHWGQQSYRLPLPPAPLRERRSKHSLVEFLCRKVFMLECNQLTVQEEERLPPEALRAVRAIQTNQSKISVFGDGWCIPETRHILWIDRIEAHHLALLNSGLFLIPAHGHALELQSYTQPLRERELFTEHVLVLGQSGEQSLIAIPVRSQYAALVREARLRIQDERVEVDLSLVDGRAVSRSYRSTEVIRTRDRLDLELFSWPRRMTLTSGAHEVLFAQTIQDALSFRVLYGERTSLGLQGLSLASQWNPGSPFFHHFTPYEHGLQAFHGPLGLVIRSNGPRGIAALTQSKSDSEGTQPIELGVIPYELISQEKNTHHERWCVDLGSSSSVVARYFEGLGNASVVSPSKEGDATAVYSLGEKVRREELAWFATWEDYTPADSASAILPSQVIELRSSREEQERTDVNSRRYGQDFVLDNGHQINKSYLNNSAGRVIENLKWRDDAEGGYRLRYLQHMLELAVAMESMRSDQPGTQNRTLPGEIELVFTLPLRQRNELPRFQTEIRQVCDRLRDSTSLVFSPRFQWESLAVVPEQVNVAGSAMFVVADLGGGTLDMYAASYQDGARQKHSLESARIGGRYCVDLLMQKRALGGNLDERTLRGGLDNNDLNVIISEAPEVNSYFEIIHRYIVLWVESLRARWELTEDATIFLMLAGLGWSLPGSRRTQQGVSKALDKVSANLGLKLDFEPWGEDPARSNGQTSDENRKTFLARTCAKRGGVASTDELIRVAEEADMVLGLAIRSGGETFEKTHPLNELDEVRSFIIQQAEAQKVTGDELGAQLLTAEVTARIASRLSGSLRVREQFSGSFDPVVNHMVTSALTIVAEQAIQKLIGK